MTLDKYEAVRKAAAAFAEATETGCRQQREKEEKLVKEWVWQNCRDRKKSSAYAVYTSTKNLGTKQWSHLITTVDYFPLEGSRETECFVIDKWGNRHSKDHIIGYLGK